MGVSDPCPPVSRFNSSFSCAGAGHPALLVLKDKAHMQWKSNAVATRNVIATKNNGECIVLHTDYRYHSSLSWGGTAMLMDLFHGETRWYNST